jgi:hypothetical protein
VATYRPQSCCKPMPVRAECHPGTTPS